MTDKSQDELDDEAEEEMMKELILLKEQLEAIMRKYPHASYYDVTDWLKQ